MRALRAHRPTLIGLLAAFAASFASGCDGGDRPRGVLLVSVDTLRADFVGELATESTTTPTLDELASEGAVFRNAWATSPWTLPSHGSLLTGLYPRAHGAIAKDDGVARTAPLLAEVLSEAGFSTAAVVNAPFVSPRYGFGRGFDSFQQVSGGARRDDGEVVTLALGWLALNAGSDFFLFVHDYRVHSDYVSPMRFRQEYTGDYAGDVDGSTRQLRDVREGKRVLDDADLAHLRGLYAAGVRYMDDGLARLVAGLRQLDRLDSTLIIVTSDHGEEFLEHGGVLHGRTQYEEVLRVPLVLRGPGIPKGLSLDGRASLVDVAPTILDLVGVAPPERLDGISLVPVLRGDDSFTAFDDRVVIAEADHRVEAPDTVRAIARGRFKLIVDRAAGSHALYDLEADPAELENVANEHPELVRALLGQLSVHENAGERGEALPALDEETRAELEALGYF